MPGHASHMPQPPQPPSHQVGLERADAEPLLQRLRRDAVLLHMPHVNAALMRIQPCACRAVVTRGTSYFRCDPHPIPSTGVRSCMAVLRCVASK
jgi:hypothetical protein